MNHSTNASSNERASALALGMKFAKTASFLCAMKLIFMTTQMYTDAEVGRPMASRLPVLLKMQPICEWAETPGRYRTVCPNRAALIRCLTPGIRSLQTGSRRLGFVATLLRSPGDCSGGVVVTTAA